MGYEQSKHLAMRDIYVDSNYIYFSNYTFNALISMDRETKELRYIDSFRETFSWNLCPYRKVINYKGNLFFFPDDSKGISRYNLITKEQEFFKSNEERIELAGVISFDRYAYLIPRSIRQPFYIFDMETGCYESKGKWNSMILEKLNIDTEIFIWPVCNIEKTIWILLKDLNVLVETSIDEWHIEIYYLDKDILFNSLTTDGENIWLSSSRDDVIVCWNKSKGIIKRYILSKYRDDEAVKDIACLYFAQNKIFVLPQKEKELFIINLFEDIDKVILPNFNRVCDSARMAWPLFGGCAVYGNEVYLLPYVADKMYVFNLNTDHITEYNMEFQDVKCYYRNIVKPFQIWKGKKFLMESGYEGNCWEINLKDYLYIIESGEGETIIKEHGRYGWNIHTLIKNIGN